MFPKIFFSRKFGCEFEFSTRYDQIKPIISKIIHKYFGNNSLYCKEEAYQSINNIKWNLKTDATTESELCTPISTLKQMDKICDVIKEIDRNDIKITDKDSLHVHLDIAGIDKEKVLALWLKYEPVIFSLFPLRRRNCFYCERSIKSKGSKKNTASFFKDALNSTEDHHSAISFSIVDYIKNKKRKTVEIRVAEGTKNYKMVRNWVLFCIYFIESSKKIDAMKIMCDYPYKSTLYDMLNEINIKDKELLEWIEKRHDEFKRNKGKNKN